MTQINPDDKPSFEAERIGDSGPATESTVAKKPERRRAAPKTAAKVTNSAKSTASKSDIVLKKLRAKNGATLEALMEATGWQAHSVRGFLSGVVRKKLGLPLTSDIGKDGKRRYRLAGPEAGAE
ncbi:DUF3489 domain-containing protein [Hoeflea sp. AS60]|uniref:DUF3489 domain-containing protein n=1 Tax=Hoeflea sp. AS60 TaxID=3135780 RepID=UPI00316B50DA